MASSSYIVPVTEQLVRGGKNGGHSPGLAPVKWGRPGRGSKNSKGLEKNNQTSTVLVSHTRAN